MDETRMYRVVIVWRSRKVTLDFQSRDGWNWYWADGATMTDDEDEEFVAQMENTNLWEYMQEVLNGRL